MKKSPWSYGVEVLILILVIVSVYENSQRKKTDQIIRSDAKGYYAYLPALFIYDDPSCDSFINTYEKKYYDSKSFVDFRKEAYGHSVLKYYSGVALLLLPFFLLAHILAHIFGWTADGYSFIYQVTMALAALVYLYLGSKALFSLFYKSSGKGLLSFLVVFFLVFGTNLYYYSIREPVMSHVFSFAMVGIFGYGLYNIFIEHKRNWIALTFFAFGIIVFIRPVDIILIGLVPFIAGSRERLMEGLRFIWSQKTVFYTGCVLAVIPMLIQCSLWYWECGHLLVYTYGGENFIFSQPQMLRILFSVRKGWFFWTPIAFIGVIGLICWFSKEIFRPLIAILILLTATYILSSWWQWYYGYSFGSRPYIDFLIFPGFGLLHLFAIKKRLLFQAGLIGACFVFTGLNLFQTYQYQNFILKWDKMSWTDYRRVFLKKDRIYDGVLWTGADSLSRYIIHNNIRCSACTGFENEKDLTVKNIENNNPDSCLYISGNLNKSDIHHKGSYSAAIDMSNQWTPQIQGLLKDNDSIVQARIWFYGKMPHGSQFAVVLNRKRRDYFTDSHLLLAYFVHKNEWTEAVAQVILPDSVKNGDRLSVFVSDNNSGDKLFIDDMQVDIITKRHH